MLSHALCVGGEDKWLGDDDNWEVLPAKYTKRREMYCSASVSDATQRIAVSQRRPTIQSGRRSVRPTEVVERAEGCSRCRASASLADRYRGELLSYFSDFVSLASVAVLCLGPDTAATAEFVLGWIV